MIPDRKYIHELKDVIGRFDNVCDWFDKLGLRYPRTRYGHYNRIFKEFETHALEKTTPLELMKFARSFDNAYLEANEIIRVHDSLTKIDVSGIASQIKKVIGGQEFRGTQDQSRDFLFELSIASRFIHAGYEVELDGICDVVAKVDSGITLFVECKRIKSRSRIDKNVKKANKQIVTRVRGSRLKALGMVAINISDLLSKQAHLVPDTPDEGTSIHRSISNSFIAKYFKHFGAGCNRSSLGVLCESSIMMHLAPKVNTHSLFYSRHTEFLGYYNNDFFSDLANKLSNQNIVSH